MTLTQPTLFDHVDGPPGELVVKRVNQETALRPCFDWHYAGRIPGGSVGRYGIWENGLFQGVIMFGPSANNNAHKPFGVGISELLELQRIALHEHLAPVSRLISMCVSLLRKDAPQTSILVSYADPAVGHVGYVYQASSWVYLGLTRHERAFHLNGRTYHSKAILNIYGTKELDWLQSNIDPCASKTWLPPKHKYAFGLNRKMRKLLATMAQPYPKG